MLVVVGLVGHPSKVEMIENILKDIDNSLEMKKYVFVSIATEEQIEPYRMFQKDVDFVIVSGYYDYLFFAEKLIFNKITGYISRDITTLYRCILQAKLADFNIFNISIDGYQAKDLKEIYQELGQPIEQSKVYVWYKNCLLSAAVIEDIYQFHNHNYHENKVSVCITCLSPVYERLKKAGIPSILVSPTSENIRLTYERLRLECMLKMKETNDIIMLDINVIGSKNLLEYRDEYLLNVEKLHIAESIFLFAQKLQAMVEELNLGHYIIIGSRTAFEQETSIYKNISLLDDMGQFHHCKLSLGVGYGKSIRETQLNAQIALSKARSHNVSCAYVVYDRLNISGPYFSHPVSNKTVENQHYSEISKNTGISVNTI